MKMEDIGALTPAHCLIASPEVFQQIGSTTRLLRHTLQQWGVMPKLQRASEGLPDARSRLNYIAQKNRRCRQQGAEFGRAGQGRPRCHQRGHA